jgi:hypothetical protein
VAAPIAEFWDEPSLRKLVLAEYAFEEAAIVAAFPDLDRVGASQRGRVELHIRLVLAPAPTNAGPG